MSTAALAGLMEPVEKFLHEMRSMRAISPNTVRAYASDLAGLCSWLCERRVQEWHQVQRKQLQAWVAEGMRAGLSPRTVSRRLASVRAFARYAEEHRLIRDNPAAGLRAPKQGRSLPKDLTVDAVSGLMSGAEQAAAGGDWMHIRDLAMLELLYSSGVRLAELVGLDIHRIDLDNGRIRVLGKGGKEREVPVGGRAIDALRGWLRVRGRRAGSGEVALFVSTRGGRIGARSVQLRLRQVAQAAGLGPVHPHQLRHSFASHILQSSGNLRAVQELLGHANLATTQIYTHMDWNQMARVYDAAHPRAKGGGAPRRPPPEDAP